MRIVLALGWYFPDSVGGTEVYVAALANHYRAAGHDVAIVAPLPGVDAPRDDVHDGHRVFRYPVPVCATRREKRGDVRARGVEYLDAWLGREQADVVHVHSLVTGLGIAELKSARDSGARVIFTNHLPSLGYLCARGTLMRWGREVCDGLLDRRGCAACLLEQRGVPRQMAVTAVGLEPMWVARRAAGWQSPLGTALAFPALVEQNHARQAQLYELADRVVMLSESGAAIARANGAPPSRLVVNKLGISGDAQHARPRVDRGPTTSPVTVGYVGRYDWLKGLRPLAEAIRRVPKSLPMRFVFVGPAASATELQVVAEMRSLLGGDDRVEFRDGVAPAEVPDLLTGMDLLCAPSICFENGPTIALEALAVGTPVIGTSFGAFPENVADTVEGRLLPPGDVDALAGVLIDVARDPSRIDTWRRGIRPVRTMSMCADDYLALYKEVAA